MIFESLIAQTQGLELLLMNFSLQANEAFWLGIDPPNEGGFGLTP